MIEKYIPVQTPGRELAQKEWLGVLASCSALSLLAIAWSWRHGAMLNYGDAVAHLHIARRVFDCHQPRFSQLGSVWLPLPHILLLPFVQVYGWWANGLAGVFPSATAYIGACAGIYRLARHWLAPVSSAFALVIFATNPNLLYLQTTAMTEPLFVCEMIWIVVWLVEWRSNPNKAVLGTSPLLWWIAAGLVAAIFTRYDGWVMTLLAWSAIGVKLARLGQLRSQRFWLASIVVVAAPIFWFVYNAAAFGDWLYFMRGPYSAKAIEMQTATTVFPPHPGWHNLWVSFLFYVKGAEMDTAPVGWGAVLVVLSLLGAAWACTRPDHRSLSWALLLALPVPFYTYSVAYGSVPIFLPVWWPHSYYNVRYGIELLPAFALCLGFVPEMLNSLLARRQPSLVPQRLATILLFAFAGLNIVQMLRERPLAYVEGTKNIDAHRPYEEQIPAALRALLSRRPGAVILMDTSVDPEIVALTGVSLHETINESDLGIYRCALAAPAEHADIVLAYDGDEISAAVEARPQGLRRYRRFSTPFQPSVTLYVSDTLGAMDPASGPGAMIASLKELR